MVNPAPKKNRAEKRSSSTLTSTARAAAARRDWASAIEAWRACDEPSRQDIESALGQAEAYRALNAPAEADAALTHFLMAGGLFKPNASAEVAVSYALNAQVAGNWLEALERWRAARRAFSNAPATWAGEAAMLQILQKPNEAEEVTSEGMRLFPASIDVAAQHCNVAVMARNWPQVELRLGEMENTFPEHQHVKTAAPKIRAAICAGLAADDPAFLSALAVQAEAAGQWAMSVKIMSALHERAPEDATHVVRLGYALRATQQYEDADRLLQTAKQAFPDFAELHAQYAEVAAARQDWAEAARRWDETLERFPDLHVIWILAATSYRQAGFIDRADALLKKAIQAEPERLELRVHHAMNAERAGNWEVAVESWNAAQRLCPDDPNIRNSRGDAIWQETISRLERGGCNAGTQPDTVAAPRTERDSTDHAIALKQLALGFEGLGDNCEFGMVQRHFGADPIGLFRFAAISVKNLVTMISEEFDRLGDPSFTELDITSRGEYLIRDVRQFYLMHSFVQKDTVDKEKFLRQQLSRLAFLKGKLLEDMRNGDKTFVYKASYGIDETEIGSLHQALKAFGPNRLLVVCKVEGSHRPGAVRAVSNDLFVGYVETLYDSDDSVIDFKSWRKILETVANRTSLMAQRPNEVVLV